MTRAPSATSACAAANPRPRLPPVTRHTRSRNPRSIRPFCRVSPAPAARPCPGLARAGSNAGSPLLRGPAPACRFRAELSHPAECNKAPFMYEIEGGLVWPRPPGRPRLPSLPSAARQPARARHPQQTPVSRPFLRPAVAPGWCPFPTVNVFLRPFREPRKSPREFNWEFQNPHHVLTIPPVIRTSRRLSTGLCTSGPQVTRRNSEIPAHGRYTVIVRSFLRDVR